jgi:hypothetical protein
VLKARAVFVKVQNFWGGGVKEDSSPCVVL